jgi:GntR family transcriptional regulator
MGTRPGAASTAQDPFGGSSVPRTSFTPHYYRIEQELRARIARLRPDDALPSDAELVEEFGVSRMTARNAMQRLVQEGLVYREPGRGTFVARSRVPRQLTLLHGFSEEMRRRGAVPSSQVLSAGLRPGSPDELAALDLPAASPVVEVRRVRLADGTPMALERAVMTPACAPVLDHDLAVRSLHRTLVSIGTVPATGVSTVGAATASADDVRHLHVPRRSPLLVERRLISDQRGAPVEWTESRYVPDRYELRVEFLVEAPAETSGQG